MKESMGLADEIMDHLPPNAVGINIDRSQQKGADTIQVTTHFVFNDKPMVLDIHFNKKNKMTAAHMAAVIASYMKEPHD